MNVDVEDDTTKVSIKLTPEKVIKLFRRISDEDVKLILVNLFGGILRCDVAAKGIIEGFKSNKKSVPMVVVLRGTNSEEAKEILKGSDMEIYFSDDLPSAAKEINKRLGR